MAHRSSNKVGTTLGILHMATSNKEVTRALHHQLPINQVAHLTLPTPRLHNSMAKGTSLIPSLALLQINNTDNSLMVPLPIPTSLTALLHHSNMAIILHKANPLNKADQGLIQVRINNSTVLHLSTQGAIPRHNMVKVHHPLGHIRVLHNNTVALPSIQEIYPSQHMASTTLHILAVFMGTARLREVEVMEVRHVTEFVKIG